MESKNEGLEDDFPFQTGDFQVPAVHFPGCTHWNLRGAPPPQCSTLNWPAQP